MQIIQIRNTSVLKYLHRQVEIDDLSAVCDVFSDVLRTGYSVKRSPAKARKVTGQRAWSSPVLYTVAERHPRDVVPPHPEPRRRLQALFQARQDAKVSPLVPA